MKNTTKKSHWVLKLLCVLLFLLAVAGLFFREPIRMIWYSNVDPLQPLNVAGEWAGGTALKGVRYSEVSESDTLNLYVPDAETPPPLIVLVHGGGFVLNDCESRQAQLFYQYFRDHGYACATVNYRLAQEAVFPAAVEDVKCAVRFLRAHAEEYGYNADRITIWGESAGGYLAVMAAVTGGEAFNGLPFIGQREGEEVSPKIDLLVDYYGAVVLESRADREAAFEALKVPALVTQIANGWLSDAIRDLPWAESCEDAFLGRPFAELTEEEIQNASPLYWADRNLSADSGLKVLIRHGDADITVPWTQSRDLYTLMKERLGGENVSFDLVRNAKHADENMYSDQDLEEVKAWLDAALSRP